MKAISQFKADFVREYKSRQRRRAFERAFSVFKPKTPAVRVSAAKIAVGTFLGLLAFNLIVTLLFLAAI